LAQSTSLMSSRKPLSIILISLICFTAATAQNVKGKWYGIATAEGASASNAYLCELLISQNGTKVTGYMNYYFRDGYFSNPITGTFNATTRKLHTKAIPILYHGNIDIGTGIDCFMEGDFTLKVSKAETTLTGYFFADEAHSLTCTPVKVRFTKQLKEEPLLKDRVIEKEDEDSVVVTPPPAVPAPVPVIAPETKAREEKAKAELKTRINDFVNELEVTDDTVRIDLYDNGVVDADSISLFYNGKLVVYKEMLSDRKAISIRVPVDSITANNELIMFAENLGSTPPNSALMIISDSKHKHEVYLSSNFQKNATVRLRKAPPKDPRLLR
jgi:hypothetical protein